MEKPFLWRELTFPLEIFQKKKTVNGLTSEAFE